VIHLDSITWQAGAFRLENLTLSVPTGRYAVLMGRTGCGKTTLVEILCGLRRPQGGRVLIADRDVTHEPPGERGVGYVPQDGAMFPTMTVREHLGFALRLRRRPADEIARRVGQLAEELGIAALLDRKPQGLSGGERQRVALGRALAAQPKVLVLDEPLSALDEDLRDDLAVLLRRIQREHGITALHITHSRAEALQLADLMFRLADGRITESLARPSGTGDRVKSDTP
jgi:ABC-type sugar transport system ATPase subunit